MPENTVYVGRGSKWGNPYRVGVESETPYKDKITPKDRCHAARLFASWSIGYITARQGLNPPMLAVVGEHRVDQLRGKNLACWCPLDEPCHADVLLKLANTTPKEAQE